MQEKRKVAKFIELFFFYEMIYPKRNVFNHLEES